MDVLISEVQKRDLLWNRRNPHHRDRLIVDKEWCCVAENIRISKEDAKKKWRNLRDQFLKEYKKIPKGKTAASEDNVSKYSGKWQYFTSLLFLKDTVTPNDTGGNMLTLDILEESQNFTAESARSEEMEETDMDNMEALTVSSCVSSEYKRLNTTSSGPKLKKQREEDEGPEMKLSEIKKRKHAPPEKDEDESSLFLRSLLPYLRKLSPLQQLRVRTEFQEILMQAMQSNTLDF